MITRRAVISDAPGKDVQDVDAPFGIAPPRNGSAWLGDVVSKDRIFLILPNRIPSLRQFQLATLKESI
jgi:hypothetical protein